MRCAHFQIMIYEELTNRCIFCRTIFKIQPIASKCNFLSMFSSSIRYLSKPHVLLFGDNIWAIWRMMYATDMPLHLSIILLRSIFFVLRRNSSISPLSAIKIKIRCPSPSLANWKLFSYNYRMERNSSVWRVRTAFTSKIYIFIGLEYDIPLWTSISLLNDCMLQNEMNRKSSGIFR